MKPLLAAAIAALAFPAMAQVVPTQDGPPRNMDARQTPEEIRQTDSLNAGVLGRIDEVDRANAQAQADNEADLAAYQVRTAQADNARATIEAEHRAHESAQRAYEAAQAQYRDDMAQWRQTACRAGQRSACVPRS